MKARDVSQCVRFGLDIVAICIAWNLSINVRIALNPLAGVFFQSTRIDLWAPSILRIMGLWLVSALWLKFYRPCPVLHLKAIVRRSLEAALLLSVITMFVTFASRGAGLEISRTFVLVMCPISLFCFAIVRSFDPLLDECIHTRWPRTERVAVIGEANAALQLVNSLNSRSGSSELRGLILSSKVTAEASVGRVRVLGTMNQLGELINLERLDRLILVSRTMSEMEIETCSSISRRMGVSVSCAVGLPTAVHSVHVSTFHGVPVVDVIPIRIAEWQIWVKRCMDIFLASCLLVAFAPLLLLIALAVKLTSEGPVLYKSSRVGKGGRHFTFLKFRSMFAASSRSQAGVTNDRTGHIFKDRNDPRVTPFGSIMRRYSLDELPQLVNVLRGEMSIVGPRPLPAQDLEPDGMSREFATWAELRSRVQPGITGLWQVRGRSDLPFESMVELDMEYIRVWSLLGDVRILLETPALVLNGVGAY